MAQTQAEHHDPNVYFVPHDSKWPVFASVALFILFFGLASWFNEVSWGRTMFFVGAAGLILILFKWFADVILESVSGYHNRQVDGSFRMGMVWFIFSEVMFFAAFFGALFYARQLSLPWLGGAGDGVGEHHVAEAGAEVLCDDQAARATVPQQVTGRPGLGHAAGGGLERLDRVVVRSLRRQPRGLGLHAPAQLAHLAQLGETLWSGEAPVDDHRAERLPLALGLEGHPDPAA